MELRQIQYFVKVAEKLNFSQAAQELFISQPALSQQIAALENELGGVLLLRRNKQGVSLTAQGQVFYEKGKYVLELLDNLTAQIKTMGDDEDKNLHISLIKLEENTVLTYGISDAIFRFMDRYPDIKVSLSYIDALKLSDVLLSREADIVLCVLPSKEYQMVKFEKR